MEYENDDESEEDNLGIAGRVQQRQKRDILIYGSAGDGLFWSEHDNRHYLKVGGQINYFENVSDYLLAYIIEILLTQKGVK